MKAFVLMLPSQELTIRFRTHVIQTVSFSFCRSVICPAEPLRLLAHGGFLSRFPIRCSSCRGRRRRWRRWCCRRRWQPPWCRVPTQDTSPHGICQGKEATCPDIVVCNHRWLNQWSLATDVAVSKLVSYLLMFWPRSFASDCPANCPRWGNWKGCGAFIQLQKRLQLAPWKQKPYDAANYPGRPGC